MKKRSATLSLDLGSQIAAQGADVSGETIEALNGLRNPGYRLTRHSTALAEKILSKDGSGSAVRIFLSLGDKASLGIAAMQLGLALAVLSKTPTLIVNASGAHPELDKAFGKASGGGLSSLLKAGSDWRDEVVQTKVPDLAFLPYGKSKGTGSAALTAQSLGSLFEGMREDYPQIIVVGSSLDSEESSSLLLGGDHVVGIAGSGETTRRQVEELEESCHSLGRPLLGVVLQKA